MANIKLVFGQKEVAGTQTFFQTGATTESPYLWIRYLGTTGSGATVEVEAAGNMVFTTDGTTADTTVNATGTIDMSTPPAASDTFGEVGALINASANWECVLLAVTPTATTYKDTNNTIAVSAETDLSTAAYKETGAFFYGDGAVAPNLVSFCISGFDPAAPGDGRNYWNDENCISYITWMDVTCNFSAAGAIKVYSASQTGQTLVWTDALADDTATTFGSTGNLRNPVFASKLGERLVVIVDNDQTTTGDNLAISGYTVDLSGNRIVTGYKLTNALLA